MQEDAGGAREVRGTTREHVTSEGLGKNERSCALPCLDLLDLHLPPVLLGWDHKSGEEERSIIVVVAASRDGGRRERRGGSSTTTSSETRLGRPRGTL